MATRNVVAVDLGAESGRVMLARFDGQRLDLEEIHRFPSRPVTLRGHVAPWPSHWFEVGHGRAGAVRQNLELASFSAESGLALRPVKVFEDASADNAGDGLRRNWPAPTAGVSIATHYGYATQWFAMSVAFLGLWVWLQFIRPRRRTPDDSAFPPDARADDPAPR